MTALWPRLNVVSKQRIRTAERRLKVSGEVMQARRLRPRCCTARGGLTKRQVASKRLPCRTEQQVSFSDQRKSKSCQNSKYVSFFDPLINFFLLINLQNTFVIQPIHHRQKVT